MFTITKDNTITKVKAEVKASITEFLIECLEQKYGKDNVHMVRTGNTSKANEIAAIIDEATGEDGEVNSVVITLNPTVKEFANHTSDKGKVFEPFDFAAASNEYDDWVAEKAEKAAAAEKSKAEKAAKDAEKRAKAKTKD